MPANSLRRYPPELRARAVRMVAEITDQHESEWAAMGEAARQPGVGNRRDRAQKGAPAGRRRRPRGD